MSGGEGREDTLIANWRVSVSKWRGCVIHDRRRNGSWVAEIRNYEREATSLIIPFEQSRISLDFSSTSKPCVALNFNIAWEGEEELTRYSWKWTGMEFWKVWKFPLNWWWAKGGAVKKSTIIFFARLGSDPNRVHPARLSCFELSPLFPGFNEGFPRCYPHPINLLSRAITNNSKKEDL